MASGQPNIDYVKKRTPVNFTFSDIEDDEGSGELWDDGTKKDKRDDGRRKKDKGDGKGRKKDNNGGNDDEDNNGGNDDDDNEDDGMENGDNGGETEAAAEATGKKGEKRFVTSKADRDRLTAVIYRYDTKKART